MRIELIYGMLAALFPLSGSCVVPEPYSADKPLPVAMTYCYPGESCITCDSEMPIETVNDVLGLELTEGEVLLFTPNPEQPESRDWVWSATGTMWPALVEQKYSGKGNREQPPACAHRAALKGSHQPKDGIWRVTQSKIEVQNCAVASQQELPAESSRIRFENPFRGRLSAEESHASIVQISPNAFASREVHGEHLGKTLLDVQSPEKMKMYFVTYMSDPDDKCTTRFTIDYDFESP